MPSLLSLAVVLLLHFIQCLKIGYLKNAELQPIVFEGRTYFALREIRITNYLVN